MTYPPLQQQVNDLVAASAQLMALGLMARMARSVAGPLAPAGPSLRFLPAPASSPETLPVQEWRTIASRIPAMRWGRFAVVKRPIRAGSYLAMNGVFGYERCVFLRDEVVTILYEGEKDPASDPRGVWMSDSPYEYYGMWQLVARAKPGRVLVGGLGLGILANLLALRTDITAVTAVELSPEVVQMIGPCLSPRVRVVQGDFLRMLGELERKRELFDTVIADIFRSAEEQELYEDTRMAMEDAYPDAEHLFWAFQERYEEEKLRYWALGRAVRGE